MPLVNTIGCLDSYISFICKKNFQSCDIITNTTFEMCSKVCDDFVDNCGTNLGVCSNLDKMVILFL